LYIYGESSEPFHYWANHYDNLGFTLYFIAVYAGAGGTAVEAAWDLIDRFRGRQVTDLPPELPGPPPHLH
jgi:hypothetical protein